MNILNYIEELESGYLVVVTRRTANILCDWMIDNDFDPYEYNMSDDADGNVEIWKI